MSFNSADLKTATIHAELIEHLIDEHETVIAPRLNRLWDYYRNDMTDNDLPGPVARVYRLAQEQGLPARLRGTSESADGGALPHGLSQREIVIENDIAWRIHTLVDFMFAKPVGIRSCAPDIDRAAFIESFLQRVFDLNGGVSFFQDLALLGSVHGHVDVLLRVADNDRPDPSRMGGPISSDETVNLNVVLEAAKRFTLETIEATRSIPVLNPDDYRQLDAYVVHFRQTLNELADNLGFLARARAGVMGRSIPATQRAMVDCTQIFTDQTVLLFKAHRPTARWWTNKSTAWVESRSCISRTCPSRFSTRGLARSNRSSRSKTNSIRV